MTAQRFLLFRSVKESLGRRLFDFAGAFAVLEKLNGTLIRDAFDSGRLA